jgi:hypothetical protein
MGWCNNRKLYKCVCVGHVAVQARDRGKSTCLAHALQCLCDGRACCPARALQLVICRSGGVHRHRHLLSVVSTRCFTGMVRVGVKIPQDGNRAIVYEHVAMVHGHVWRTLCSVCATGAHVAQPLPCNS